MLKCKMGFVLLLVLVVGIFLSVCGLDDVGKSGGDKKVVDFKVGMVIDMGGVDDKLFN